MQISVVRIENFKRISGIEIGLSKVNYLVGGNNSGKSSVLQAIHMAASCAKLSLERKEQVLPEAELRYSPTSEFVNLGHVAPYENKATGSRGRVEFEGIANDGTAASYRIEIYKGRNYGNVGVDRAGSYNGFGQEICDPKSMFSVFVPGLAGIPHREEYKNYASVFLKAAGGEANLVFRNIIRILEENGKLHEVNEILAGIVGACEVIVDHDAERDLYVDVHLSHDGKVVPIDLTGTGILQLIQIISYVSLFEPKFLLVDEPDSHLHPSRQALLAKTFDTLAEMYGSTIIVTTHSRHLVAAASGSAKIIWMKDGQVESDECKDLASVLMDIGALDQLDPKTAECIICTEDKGKKALEACVDELGLKQRVQVVSYNGISNAASAVAIKGMADLLPKAPKIIIHRDRDFLTDEEISKWGLDFSNRGLTVFSPRLCDIETYHCTPSHIASIYKIDLAIATSKVEEVLIENFEDFKSKFRSKRQEANAKYWKDGGSPVTTDLWPENEPASVERAYGKKMLACLNDKLPKDFGKRHDLFGTASAPLKAELKDVFTKVGM